MEAGSRWSGQVLALPESEMFRSERRSVAGAEFETETFEFRVNFINCYYLEIVRVRLVSLDIYLSPSEELTSRAK